MVIIVGFTQFFFQFTCSQRDDYNAINRMKNVEVVFNEQDKTKINDLPLLINIITFKQLIFTNDRNFLSFIKRVLDGPHILIDSDFHRKQKDCVTREKNNYLCLCVYMQCL